MSVSEWVVDPDGEHTRRIGPWVLRVWFYDPAVDGTPDAPASWWWSVCLAGMDEVHVGVEGAPETLLRIGGGKCDDAAEGRNEAMTELWSWTSEQFDAAVRSRPFLGGK